MKNLFEYLISKENKKKIKFSKKRKLKEGNIIILFGGMCYTVVNTSTLKSFQNGKWDNPSKTKNKTIVFVRLDTSGKKELEFLDIDNYDEYLNYIGPNSHKENTITTICPNKNGFSPKDIPDMIGVWYVERVWKKEQIKIEDF